MVNVRKIFLRVVVICFFAFAFVALVYEPGRSTPLLPSLGTAALIALVILVRMDFFENVNEEIVVVEERSSADGIVTGIIEDWPFEKRVMCYRCTVKSNYPDKVYFQEGEFNTLEEAQAWLETTYAQELAKHEERTSRLPR